MGVKAGAFGGTAEDKKTDSKAARAARRGGAKSSNGTGKTAAKKTANKPAARKTAAKKGTTAKKASRKARSDKGFHVLEVYPNAAALVEAGYEGEVVVDLGVYDETTGSKAVDALVDDATKAQEGVPRDGDFIPVSVRSFKVEKIRHEEVAPRRYRA